MNKEQLLEAQKMKMFQGRDKTVSLLLSDILMMQVITRGPAFNKLLDEISSTNPDTQKIREWIDKTKEEATSPTLYQRIIDKIATQQFGERADVLRELSQNGIDSYELSDVQRRVYFAIDEDDDYTKLSVRDFGAGMSMRDAVKFLLIPYNTTKGDGSHKIGEHGVGWFSVVGASDSVQVISKKRGSQGYTKLMVRRREDGDLEAILSQSDTATFEHNPASSVESGTEVTAFIKKDEANEAAGITNRTIKELAYKYMGYVDPALAKIILGDSTINSLAEQYLTGMSVPVKIGSSSAPLRMSFSKRALRGDFKDDRFTHRNLNLQQIVYTQHGLFVKFGPNPFAEGTAQYDFLNDSIKAGLDFWIDLPANVGLTVGRNDIVPDNSNEVLIANYKAFDSLFLESIIGDEEILYHPSYAVAQGLAQALNKKVLVDARLRLKQGYSLKKRIAAALLPPLRRSLDLSYSATKFLVKAPFRLAYYAMLVPYSLGAGAIKGLVNLGTRGATLQGMNKRGAGPLLCFVKEKVPKIVGGLTVAAALAYGCYLLKDEAYEAYRSYKPTLVASLSEDKRHAQDISGKDAQAAPAVKEDEQQETPPLPERGMQDRKYGASTKKEVGDSQTTQLHNPEQDIKEGLEQKVEQKTEEQKPVQKPAPETAAYLKEKKQTETEEMPPEQEAQKTTKGYTATAPTPATKEKPEEIKPASLDDITARSDTLLHRDEKQTTGQEGRLNKLGTFYNEFKQTMSSLFSSARSSTIGPLEDAIEEKVPSLPEGYRKPISYTLFGAGGLLGVLASTYLLRRMLKGAGIEPAKAALYVGKALLLPLYPIFLLGKAGYRVLSNAFEYYEENLGLYMNIEEKKKRIREARREEIIREYCSQFTKNELMEKILSKKIFRAVIYRQRGQYRTIFPYDIKNEKDIPSENREETKLSIEEMISLFMGNKLRWAGENRQCCLQDGDYFVDSNHPVIREAISRLQPLKAEMDAYYDPKVLEDHLDSIKAFSKGTFKFFYLMSGLGMLHILVSNVFPSIGNPYEKYGTYKDAKNVIKKTPRTIDDAVASTLHFTGRTISRSPHFFYVAGKTTVKGAKHGGRLLIYASLLLGEGVFYWGPKYLIKGGWWGMKQSYRGGRWSARNIGKPVLKGLYIGAKWGVTKLPIHLLNIGWSAAKYGYSCIKDFFEEVEEEKREVIVEPAPHYEIKSPQELRRKAKTLREHARDLCSIVSSLSKKFASGVVKTRRAFSHYPYRVLRGSVVYPYRASGYMLKESGALLRDIAKGTGEIFEHATLGRYDDKPPEGEINRKRFQRMVNHGLGRNYGLFMDAVRKLDDVMSEAFGVKRLRVSYSYVPSGNPPVINAGTNNHPHRLGSLDGWGKRKRVVFNICDSEVKGLMQGLDSKEPSRLYYTLFESMLYHKTSQQLNWGLYHPNPTELYKEKEKARARVISYMLNKRIRLEDFVGGAIREGRIADDDSSLDYLEPLTVARLCNIPLIGLMTRKWKFKHQKELDEMAAKLYADISNNKGYDPLRKIKL